MMFEEGKANVISVELAIRKELAYRKKVASLYPDSEDDLLPLKVPSNARPNVLFGQNQPSYASQLHDMSSSSSIPRGQMQGGGDSVSWQYPSMNVGATYPTIEGTSSGNGILPCYASQQPPPPQVYDVNSLFFCKVCKVPCSGQVSYKQHVKGQKHRAKLQLHQMIRNGNGHPNKKPHLQQPKCNVCEIWCSDENALRLHFLGQKHKAKLLEIGHGGSGGGGGRGLSQQRWCQLCHVPCTNEDAFRLHLQGKNHLALSRAMGEKKKII